MSQAKPGWHQCDNLVTSEKTPVSLVTPVVMRSNSKSATERLFFDNCTLHVNACAFFQHVFFSNFVFVNIFCRENGFEPDLDSYSPLLLVYGEAGNLEAILKVVII